MPDVEALSTGPHVGQQLALQLVSCLERQGGVLIQLMHCSTEELVKSGFTLLAEHLCACQGAGHRVLAHTGTLMMTGRGV